jgi:hypothetical protein
LRAGIELSVVVFRHACGFLPHAIEPGADIATAALALLGVSFAAVGTHMSRRRAPGGDDHDNGKHGHGNV